MNCANCLRPCCKEQHCAYAKNSCWELPQCTYTSEICTRPNSDSLAPPWNQRPKGTNWRHLYVDGDPKRIKIASLLWPDSTKPGIPELKLHVPLLYTLPNMHEIQLARKCPFFREEYACSTNTRVLYQRATKKVRPHRAFLAYYGNIWCVHGSITMHSTPIWGRLGYLPAELYPILLAGQVKNSDGVHIEFKNPMRAIITLKCTEVLK